MSIRQKGVTALIGPSGCGKSTFLRTLNRMNDLIEGRRISGQVLIDGTEIYHPQIDVVALRKRVGMVFQKSNPFPKSVYENVAYGPRIAGVSSRAALDSVVEQALERAALWNEVKDRLRDSALNLSGGQQQRLCIARALAPNPEVVLRDEPAFAALRIWRTVFPESEFLRTISYDLIMAHIVIASRTMLMEERKP